MLPYVQDVPSQAASSRARGYRNETSFIAMIYMIGSPVGRLLDQAKST